MKAFLERKAPLFNQPPFSFLQHRLIDVPFLALLLCRLGEKSSLFPFRDASFQSSSTMNGHLEGGTLVSQVSPLHCHSRDLIVMRWPVICSFALTPPFDGFAFGYSTSLSSAFQTPEVTLFPLPLRLPWYLFCVSLLERPSMYIPFCSFPAPCNNPSEGLPFVTPRNPRPLLGDDFQLSFWPWTHPFFPSSSTRSRHPVLWK